ncbi:MAG: RNA methyltransferase [Candidatus Nitricoxidivorans perseverans]|uniref:RNA methyltransferase n=1 Tax=Candidatus Nitricoxidivorans perseverans TaxID=2975601 RepID=A0AA49FLJ8_9PROT|nr:MAG: RNA methyltransferase [Candidatus Nitricoxidivorans perseverans]
MKSIVSRDNVTFKALRALAEDAREQRRQGRTVLDGPHLVGAYLDRIGKPEFIAISESGSGNPEVQRLLAAHDGEAISLKDSLFREISGVASPVGLLAVIAIPEAPTGSTEGSCVLLDGVQDAGNVGSILRSAAAAGIADIALGPGCAGAWTPRVLRAGQGAHFSLRIREQADLAALIRDWHGTGVATVARGGTPIYALELSGDVAWLFGNEGAGLSPLLLGAAAVRAEIPMAAGNESLNVAAAAAVCLFEEVRQKRAKEKRHA